MLVMLWRYNNAVQTAWTVAVVVVGAAMYAQSTPPFCPAGRPVDDIIAQARKEQSISQEAPQWRPFAARYLQLGVVHRPFDDATNVSRTSTASGGTQQQGREFECHAI